MKIVLIRSLPLNYSPYLILNFPSQEYYPIVNFFLFVLVFGGLVVAHGLFIESGIIALILMWGNTVYLIVETMSLVPK